MKVLITIFVSMLPSLAYSQGNPDSSIYEKIWAELHNCFVTSTIKDSTKRKEYCYKTVLDRNYDVLKTYGVDTLQNKDFKRYYDLYLKRFNNKKTKEQSPGKVDTKDEAFIGSLVKQEKLEAGKFEITLKSRRTNITKKFLSTGPLDENELKRFKGKDDNIIISYQPTIREGKEENVVKSVVYLGMEEN